MKALGAKRGYGIYWLFILPSLLGVLAFYIVPFFYSFYYALLDNLGARNFVGLRNFAYALTNELFLQASLNTVLFMVLTVPLGMGLGLFLAGRLRGLRRGKALAAVCLILPFVVPSGATAYFWQIIFGINGLWNKLMIQQFGANHAELVAGQWTMGILVIVYLWKYTSFNIILFWAGLNWIPNVYYEQIHIDGGGIWSRFRHVTWVYLLPTTLVVLLMSIVNSFRVFREIQLIYGAYPTRDIYMLQHYMNNQFEAMNMARLSSAAYIMFLALGLILLAVFYVQKRVTDSY